MEMELLQKNYCETADDLLEWINSKLNHFNSQEKLESLEKIQNEIEHFKTYRTVEKPNISERKNEIEALYFNIQLNRTGWKPPQNVSPVVIDKVWSGLQKAEHEHEISIRNQLKEQERLENLAYKFETKRHVREGYIEEIKKILTDPNYGASIKQSDATFKKHEAIRTGIMARELMMQDLFKIADILIDSNYRRKDNIETWKNETEEKWNYVLRLLEVFDEKFAHLRQVMSTLQEISSIQDEMQQLQVDILNKSDPLDIESSLQRHALKEVQVASWGEAVHRFEGRIERDEEIKDTSILRTHVKKLRQIHDSLNETCKNRRQVLEDQLKMKEHKENVEEIMGWIFEKKLFCSSEVQSKDLAGTLILQKKHKALKSEILLYKELVEKLKDQRLQEAFLQLETLWETKEKFIYLTAETKQYISDADECSSWIAENMNLLSTLDFGTDELTCDALLRRHIHNENKILAYCSEINRLKNECERLNNSFAAYSETIKSNNNSSQHDSAENLKIDVSGKLIQERQMELENSFDTLQTECQERKARLQHHYMYFNFKDRCDEVQKWQREKERILDSIDFEVNSDEVENNFEEFLTDMLAHSRIIDELTSIAHQLDVEEADQRNTAKMLLDDIQRRWQHLNQLTRIKEQNVKGLTSALLGQRMCQESISWLNEAFKSEEANDCKEIRSFEELRRKQEALDREGQLIEDRVKQAIVLLQNNSSSEPLQKNETQSQIKKLQENWEDYQVKLEKRKEDIEKIAGIQIFKYANNDLLEWSNSVLCKLKIREKISDLEVAQSLAKEHRDLGDEIEMEEDRFIEIEEFGNKISQIHPEVVSLLDQTFETKRQIHELWNLKEEWLCETSDFLIFEREANQLQSLCISQNALLKVADCGENLSDVEMLIKHHETFMDTLHAQRNRFFAFNEMAEKLINLDHEQKAIISHRRDEVLNTREEVIKKANTRKLRLEQELHVQEFQFDSNEMMTWIEEKNKRAVNLLQCDSKAKLSTKLKRLDTLRAELSANQNRLQNLYAKGESLVEECSFAKLNLEKILEDLETAWNLLCERLDSNRASLYREKELSEYSTNLDLMCKKVDDLVQAAEAPVINNDPRSLKHILKKQEALEKDAESLREKTSKLKKQAKEMVNKYDCVESVILTDVDALEKKLEDIRHPIFLKREDIETSLQFHHFKSEVEREIMWISDQIISLSSENPCQNLLEAQKLSKHLENLEVTFEGHEKIVQNLSKEALVLVAEKLCDIDITKTCEEMQEKRSQMLQLFQDKKAKAHFNLKAQMFFTEAAEISAWIEDKKRSLSSTEYGKEEEMVIKLLTKQKDTEIEIDSYRALIQELLTDAESLIESNNPMAKIIKNKKEIIEQEMKNIQILCSTRRQNLLDSKAEREFENETNELSTWINEQMVYATPEEYGDDYEHVLLLHSNFEFFQARVEAGTKRIVQYEDFAKRLENSKCPFLDKVKDSLENLSTSWTELLDNIAARAFKLEAAAEIHRYHRDVTDILARIHTYYQGLPNDLGATLSQAQQLAKKHDATENELLGIEAQVHLLLDDAQKLQETYPGGNEEHIQLQLALVVENWNMLQQKVASRKANLIASQRIHKFLSLVKEEENWSKQICFELESQNISRDIEQISNQQHTFELEIEARLSGYEALNEDGQSLLSYNLFQNQIKEKCDTLSQIKERIKKSRNSRSQLVEQTKAVIMWYNEAKQIQSSIATKGVQLCGSETKETVEDLESSLKRHLEFQKTMELQEEKFRSWESQGQKLIKYNVAESERIQKKLDDLCNRRNRLLIFSKERCESFSKSLKLAKFKRDTIEVETWVLEKKNKLRTLLNDYKQLNADEKIKCLQKQQAVQAEVEAHKCIIERIIQQKEEIPEMGEDLNVRVELILEDWREVKKRADRIGSDLREAQDMLVVHDYFEKAESWIKEKELLIQKNDTGKDYEHCVSLQNKLDNNESSKVDTNFMQKMKELAEKLSRKENQNGVYIRFERIYEKWNYLQSEITLYRRKLSDALEVHTFLKDIDDTMDQIREKLMFLSNREDVQEVEAAETVRRKFEAVEKDSRTLGKRIKEQCIVGNSLAERHELSSGKIHDKIAQIQRLWVELENDLERKKQHLNAVYISLKVIKDAENMEKIVDEICAEMEYGDIPADSADAISLLQAHHAFKAQILSCQESITSLETYGNTVLQTPGILIDDVRNSMKGLSQMKRSLDNSWDYRLKQLIQHRDVQIFTEKAKQIETWFTTKEAFLANEDVGDSISSVEALLRKHENFEKSCLAYFDKIQELETLAHDLGSQEECKEIESWFQNLCQQRDRLLEASSERKDVLKDSKIWQKMLLDIYEVTNWMKEKIQLVSEEPCRDLTNLLSRTKKHATLEAEILSNHSRVVSITSQADELLQQNHFASDQIRLHISDLEDLWQHLMDSTNEQKQKLNVAHNALQFEQKLEDINNSLDQTESQLEFCNYVYDAAAIQHEIDKLQCLEKDMEQTEDKIKVLTDAYTEFDPSPEDEVVTTLKSTEQRFQDLESRIAQRYVQLQEDFSVSSFEKDINDELSWIEDNIAVCQSEEYFNDILSVQVLQKKLQALETERESREPLIHSIIERGVSMKNENVESKAKLLERRFQELVDSIRLRRSRLSDALEAQKYYFEVAQSEIWIKERMTQIASCNTGSDVYSVQEARKKITTLEAIINGYKSNLVSMEEFCSNLEGRGHYDARNIRAKQEEVNNKYEELTCSVLKMIAILHEEEEFFIFQRDVDSIITQLRSMSSVTNSNEIGRDAKHVEVLLQKLELYRFKLRNYQKSVKDLQKRATVLMDGGHTESPKIQQLLTDLEDTWMECDFTAETRYKVLEQSKMIHSFNKSVDETISWMYEKDVAFSSENFGHDLQSIQSLIKHHETLEGDLKAIEEQVDALDEEATALILQYSESEYAIQEKMTHVKSEWENCNKNAAERLYKLSQAEQMQSYFDELRDFHAWIHEMSALITTTDLPQDVAACDALLAQHHGYKSDIDAQIHSFRSFEDKGNEIINCGHFMAKEIEEKLKNLNSSFDELLSLWENRTNTHEQNLDLQLFKKRLNELDSWLQGQEHHLSIEDGRTLSEVDYLISKHEQFEQKLYLYETKFQELQNLTKVEEEIIREKDNAQRKKIDEEQLLEQKRLEELKKKEEKLVEERNQEREKILIQHRGKSVTNDDSLDDLYHDDLPEKDQVFPRIGSRRYTNKSLELSKQKTPVILRKKYTVPKSVPPTTAESFLDRKQEKMSGGKRSNTRAWKTYYTVMCGQLLCFFKDKKSFLEQNAAKPPINILGARCLIPKDYQKKKNVFRLEPADGSSFLFEAPNTIKREEWIQKINFTSSLHPSMQLMSASDPYDNEDTTEERFGELDRDSRSSTYRKADDDEQDFYSEIDVRNPRKFTSESEKHFQSSNADEETYDNDSQSFEPVSNPLYGVPQTESYRDSVTSYDEYDLQSARSSLSNQSSYRTALASTSSINTLQDERAESSEEDFIYSLPEPLNRTKSETSVDAAKHDKVSKTLPKERPPKRKESRWKAFSLRRKR